MDEYYDQEYREVFGDQGVINFTSNRQIWLSWEDLKYRRPLSRGIWGISAPKNYKDCLTGIWGGAAPGEMMSILGEVHSGKSIILKALAGCVKMKRGDSISGRVLVNGCPRGQRWRRICAFVDQSQKEYHGLLTIKEQLQFRSELALPDKWTSLQRNKVVEWVIESLNLQGIQNLAVDRLNLCERRRLAIGLALVGLPRVLLLDEPTDGLDPTRALDLLQIIRRITQQRQMTTVITAKHLRQSSLTLFDNFLLIAQGSTVYSGKFQDAIKYFETRLHVPIAEKDDNPLTCMLDAVSCTTCRRDPGHVENICKEWATYAAENQLYHTNYPNILIPDDSHFSWQRNWFIEFKEQLKRSFTLFMRNQKYLIGQTFMSLILALILAFCAFQLSDQENSVRATFDLLYFTAVFFLFFPFIPFLFVCYRDKWVLRRERRDSLVRVSTAYLANWVLIYTYRILIVTLYTCIVYFISGLRQPFNYTLVFWLTLLVEAWVAMGIGYLIVTLVEDMAVAETISSLVLLLSIWFSGDFAFNRTCTWILRWMAYLSPIFYSFNALANNQFDGTSTLGAEAIKRLGIINYGLWPSIGTLLGYGFLYMILGYIALSFNTRNKRIYI